MRKVLTKTIPKAPGIYLFKDSGGTVIYIGKAKILHNRVKSYFQNQGRDWKIDALLEEYADIDYILTKNETEALLLEAQLIRDHKPKFNVLLKTGQPFIYILFTNKDLPTIELVRNKKAKGTYFGPFLYKMAARKAYTYLIKVFRLFLCNKKLDGGCLDYHIGICAGNCKPDFDREGYIFRLHLAIDALKSNHSAFIKKIKNKISDYNEKLEFEKSKHLVEYLENMDAIFHSLKVKFSESKYEHEIFVATTPRKQVEKNYGETSLNLQAMLQLDKPPKTIDCFDISHFQSSSIVGSCIRFTKGMPDKHYFRRFKIKTLQEQNDYAALQEIVSRRYRNQEEIPDLIVIDGGKGQLGAAQAVLPPHAACISLAKREERIFSPQLPDGIVLDIKDPVGQLLIALRDYAHHFAITYHQKRQSKALEASFIHIKKPNYQKKKIIVG